MVTLTIICAKRYQTLYSVTNKRIKKPFKFKPIIAFRMYKINWLTTLVWLKLRKVQSFCRVKLIMKEEIKAKLVDKTIGQLKIPWKINRKTKSAIPAKLPAMKNFTSDLRLSQKQ